MANESINETEIRTEPCRNCPLCDGEGDLVYLKQQDRMFGAPGKWNLKQCTNKQCLLIWLDPMPVEEDIGKAYARYYTHASPDQAGRVGGLKRIFQVMKYGYLAAEYNYDVGSGLFVVRCIGQLLRMFPLRRAEADGGVRFLNAVSRGSLLDVGCGSGDWLLSMRELGWEVAGIDLDENAVIVGKQRGLNVNCGALEQQDFPRDSFDAITLNHVIEHVIDPVATLRECARILKPGGKLVMFTPNGSSLGHRIFKECWRGLEPPRHLHIFSFQSMRQALGLAGFERISVLPWIATSIIYESHLLRRGWPDSFVGARRRCHAGLFAKVFSTIELLLIKWKPSVADCMAAIAVKG